MLSVEDRKRISALRRKYGRLKYWELLEDRLWNHVENIAKVEAGTRAEVIKTTHDLEAKDWYERNPIIGRRKC